MSEPPDDGREWKQCRHCRKWFPVDDPYCKCDADAEKAGE